MKVLVFGQSGQVATELQLQCPAGWDMTALGRGQADLSHPDVCAQLIRDSGADLVINAAAYTAVDKAESEEALATIINGAAPAAMAQACADIGAVFLHISTDYVFDGAGTGAWMPDDAAGPKGAYGRSKLAGEQGVVAAGGRFAILRTSWVFSAHGSNFVKTMLRLGATRDSLTVVDDQIGGPTAAAAIAGALLAMGQQLLDGRGETGIFHFAGQPDISWADFAREIFERAGLATAVKGITTEQYGAPAPRPRNSRMDCQSLYSTFGIERPDWRAGLDDVLTALKGS